MDRQRGREPKLSQLVKLSVGEDGVLDSPRLPRLLVGLFIFPSMIDVMVAPLLTVFLDKANLHERNFHQCIAARRGSVHAGWRSAVIYSVVGTGGCRASTGKPICSGYFPKLAAATNKTSVNLLPHDSFRYVRECCGEAQVERASTRRLPPPMPRGKSHSRAVSSTACRLQAHKRASPPWKRLRSLPWET